MLLNWRFLNTEKLNIEDDWKTLCPDMTSTFKEYVNFYHNVAVCGATVDENILQSISRDNQEKSDDSDMAETVNVSKIISVAEAQKMIQQLKDYFMQSNNIDNKTFINRYMCWKKI